MFKLLSVDEQEFVRSTEWKDGTPITKEDRDLEDVIAEGSHAKWFNLSLLNEKEEEIPDPILPDQTTPRTNMFQDDYTVSTFLNQSNASRTPSVFQDDLTQNTMDSRLSVVERSVNSLQHNLNGKFEEILKAMQNGNISTPTNSVLHNPELGDPNIGGVSNSAGENLYSAHQLL